MPEQLHHKSLYSDRQQRMAREVINEITVYGTSIEDGSLLHEFTTFSNKLTQDTLSANERKTWTFDLYQLEFKYGDQAQKVVDHWRTAQEEILKMT